MKTQGATRGGKAFTLIELLVVIVVLAIFFSMIDIVPPTNDKRKAQRINCVNNLKEVGLAFRIWEGDNGDKYPMQVSVTNGGAMELAVTGNICAIFCAISNELSTPKILHCTADTEHTAATNFTTDFNNGKISYFIGVDANNAHPQMILSGDDNLKVNGVRVRSGILTLWTTSAVAWTKERHNGAGNIGLADGSVWQITTGGLISAISNAVAPSKLAIP